MAYNADNDIRTRLAEVVKNERKGDFIMIDKVQNKNTGSVSLDVRNYFTSDEDGEVHPTAKGIRIKDELALDVIVGMTGVLELDELETLRDKVNEQIDKIMSDDSDSSDEAE